MGTKKPAKSAKSKVKAKAKPKAMASPDDALIDAARAGDVAAVRALLEGGASASAEGHYGCALAAVMGAEDALALATMLLDAGADPNGASINGQTVLHDACETASPAVVKLLLDRGADVHREDETGMTPLYFAVRRPLSGAVPDPSIVDLLVDAGAKLEGGSSHSKPMHWAIEDHMHDHVRRMVARGANLDVRADYLRRTPLHSAYEYGDDAMLQLLIERGADRTIRDERGIAFDGIYGPDGEDIRPIDVQYVASDAVQRVTVTGTFAVLDHNHVGGISPAATAWAAMIAHGVGAGELDPARSRAVVVEDPAWSEIKRAGIVTRRWVLDVTSVSPRFWKLVAQQVLGAHAAYTGAGVHHVLRGVGLSIHGSASGAGASLDGATLRKWLADPAIQLEDASAELPFELEVADGPSAVSVKPAGKVAPDAIQIYLQAWLATAPLWPSTAPPGGLVIMPAKKTDFEIISFEPTGVQSRRFPFARGPALAVLRNVLRTLHAKHPLARVTVRLAS
jgi:uncharacterized protein